MNIRNTLLSFFVVFFLGANLGCNKADLRESNTFTPPAVSSNTVAQVHWLGKKRLGVMAGAYYLTRLWHLQESKQLQAQTLDKLSVAPWRMVHGEAAVQNAPSVMLRPLLEDVVQEECFFEMRNATDQTRETVFAIHLDEPRSGLWRTNLVAVIATLAGIQTMDISDNGRAWSLKRQIPPTHFELARVNDWTVVAAGGSSNVLFHEILDRLKQPQTVTSRKGETNWIEAYFNLKDMGMFSALQIPPDESPQVSLSISGDGGSILTSAKFDFPKPLTPSVTPWAVPTNLIHGPLTSFTAVRGLQPLLSPLSMWRNLQIGPAPDQLYCWAWGTNAFQDYVAIPSSDASAQVRKLTSELLEKVNPWLEQNGYVSFERMSVGDGVTWGNLPTVRPFFQSVHADADGLIFGGLLPESGAAVTGKMPDGFLTRLQTETNLMAYDWETTDSRVEATINIGQLLRMVLRRAQLPLDSASANCLRVIQPRLGNTETSLVRTGPSQLTLNRRGTVGFTAAELNLLADWMESPTFPQGLYSTRTRLEPPPGS